MAKRKKTNKMAVLIRKGVALLASVLTFVFLFLEVISSKTKYLNVIKDKTEVETVGVKFSDFLFSENYETIRETFGTATTIMWVVFVLVVLSMILTAAAFLLKKGSLASKVGAGVLVLAMVLMFAINLDQVESILKVTTWYSNMTGLYFVALAFSVVGMVSVATLKD